MGPTRDPVSEGGVDGAGAEHMIQDHCGATDYAGLVAMGRRQDLWFAGSQGDRVAVYALAQSCYEYVVGLGHVAGDDQCFGVEQVDGTGRVPRRYGAVSRRASGSPPSARSTRSRMCPTSRSCCCMRRTRAYPPAIASRHPVSPHPQATGGGRNLGVPEFACGADRSALERAAGDRCPHTGRLMP